MSVLLDSQFFGAKRDPSGAAVNVRALWGSHVSLAQQGPCWASVATGPLVLGAHDGWARGLQPLPAGSLPLLRKRTSARRRDLPSNCGPQSASFAASARMDWLYKDGRCKASPRWAGRQPRCWGTEVKGRTAPLGRPRKPASIKAPSPVRCSPGRQHHRLSLLMRLSHCWHQSGFHGVFSHPLWEKMSFQPNVLGFSNSFTLIYPPGLAATLQQ